MSPAKFVGELPKNTCRNCNAGFIPAVFESTFEPGKFYATQICKDCYEAGLKMAWNSLKKRNDIVNTDGDVVKESVKKIWIPRGWQPGDTSDMDIFGNGNNENTNTIHPGARVIFHVFDIMVEKNPDLVMEVLGVLDDREATDLDEFRGIVKKS